jgi:cyclophilin family peptidyl-prolyl cis-trans isomerase
MGTSSGGSSSYNYVSASSSGRNRHVFIGPSSIPRWMMPFAYGLVVISWMGAIRQSRHLAALSQQVQQQQVTMSLQRDDALKTLSDAKESLLSAEKQVNKLKKTHRLFEHELRMHEEMLEKEGEDMLKMMTGRKTGVVLGWFQQRQEAIKSKYEHLKKYVQDQSKQQVIEKYGPGPHRVQFRVARPDSKGKTEDFVVELAPLDVVPHSVHTFLEMITSGLWDNTVFYHHRATSHVIAAAPVAYGTFEAKHLHFQALGFTGVSFPEYSNAFPHEVYTVGFSGKGPNFYINGLDNTHHHGPGGQGHHSLPGEADPCFGKIISGHNIITAIQKGPSTSVSQDEFDATSPPVSWHDYDLTHIIHAKIL